jgi:ribonucleotide monophosphatase NagD (HAD superfamily)
MFEAAAEDTGSRHPLVVGDRLDTDIAGAVAMGWDSLLVLTGASRLEDLAASSARPTFVATGLTALLETRRPAAADAGDLPALEAALSDGGLVRVSPTR